MFTNKKLFSNACKLLCTVLLLTFTSCADAEPTVTQCLRGHTYGFWGGLWHGIIAPISFIGSLFFDSIEMYAPNNNGGWYSFGFVLGAGILGFGASKNSA